ncbi:MAG: tetratricopeptide repeat protein [Thaumarchaeota archaeon]|nr:tetratricopeptide repeat protein [Nitrososphaerota archaeon]
MPFIVDLKFPSLNKFKSSEKTLPTLEELGKSITKFEAKAMDNIKEFDGNSHELKSVAKESFAVLPLPFDSIASMVYDNSSGHTREKIKHVILFFKNLHDIDIVQYNKILNRIEETAIGKENADLSLQYDVKKIYGILSTWTTEKNNAEVKTTSDQAPEQQEEPPTIPTSTSTVLLQDESSKFEENKTYITKSLTLAGLPLVLRSEQTIQLQDETRQEILPLLEENNRLREIIQKSNKPAIEEDEYLLRIANFYYITGNSQKAAETYEYILKRNPTKMAALNNKGVVLDSTEEYDSALEYFNKALEVVPENVHVSYNKGISLYKSEKYQQAAECFDAALKIDTNYVSALTFKGHALYRLGKNNEALELYNRVIRIDRSNAEALYNKACLCSIKGDEYGAITSLERAIRLDSSWKEAASHDNDLDRLKKNPRFKEIVNYIQH